MDKVYLIRLAEGDLGQLIDGLCAREKSWRNTLVYLRDSYVPDDSFVCEECKGEEEAARIAAHYRRLVANVRKQRRDQASAKSNPERQLYLDGKSDGQCNLIARIEADWERIRRCPSVKIRRELMHLADDIYDDDYV